MVHGRPSMMLGAAPPTPWLRHHLRDDRLPSQAASERATASAVALRKPFRRASCPKRTSKVRSLSYHRNFSAPNHGDAECRDPTIFRKRMLPLVRLFSRTSGRGHVCGSARVTVNSSSCRTVRPPLDNSTTQESFVRSGENDNRSITSIS